MHESAFPAIQPAMNNAVASQTASPPHMIVADDHVALLTEIKVLADYIDRTRREIVALNADGVVKTHVTTATDELDAIVVHTAAATSTILDVCETLDSAPLPGCRLMLEAATARIYEACSFQDITGQRVAKVVQTLQAIEARIADILHVFGDGSLSSVPARPCQAHDRALLNGPQQPGAGMDQLAVDALLDTQA